MVNKKTLYLLATFFLILSLSLTFVSAEVRDFSPAAEQAQIEEGAMEEESTDIVDSTIIQVPILGTIDMADYSFIFLAIVLGFVDGLNVCSIGALIFILSMLIGLGSRRKIIVVGSLFILTVTIVYFSLVFLWFQLFTYLSPYIPMMNLIVGLIAMSGGLYYLREFYIFYTYGPNCKVEKSGIVTNMKKGIRDMVRNPKSGLGLAGAVVAFSALVTLVEFPCSAAIPAAFTSLLAAEGVGLGGYFFYIGIYALMYLSIELVVFIGAVMSSKIWLTSPKFVTWGTFIGAMVLISLGIYYLFMF